MFDVELDGLDELKEAIRGAELMLGRGVTRAVQMACEEGAEEARSRHAYTSRSGNLESKTTGYLTVSGPDFAKGEIVADAPYASYVENGRGPVIASGKALRFEAPGGGILFRRSVKAAKAFPFMGLAYLKAEAVLEREAEITLAAAAALFNR